MRERRGGSGDGEDRTAPLPHGVPRVDDRRVATRIVHVPARTRFAETGRNSDCFRALLANKGIDVCIPPLCQRRKIDFGRDEC